MDRVIEEISILMSGQTGFSLRLRQRLLVYHDTVSQDCKTPAALAKEPIDAERIDGIRAEVNGDSRSAPFAGFKKTTMDTKCCGGTLQYCCCATAGSSGTGVSTYRDV